MTNKRHSSESESGSGIKKEVLEETGPPTSVRCPVENEEDVKPLKTKGLASDVEEDGCAIEVARPDVIIKHLKAETSEPDLEEELRKLGLDDTNSGEPLQKMGVRMKDCVETKPSCEKAAKDLSNLIATLSLGEEKTAIIKDDGVKTVLDDIEKGLEALRLTKTSPSNHALRGRGFGDEFGSEDLTSYPWELDLQPAADLAIFFSRQSGDMFSTTQTSDHYGQPPVYPSHTRNTPVFGLGSTNHSGGFNPPQATPANSLGNLVQNSTGPPSSQYQHPFSHGDRPSSRFSPPFSYLGLLASTDEPSTGLPSNLSNESLISGPKRTKYIHIGGPIVNSVDAKIGHPPLDSSQIAQPNKTSGLLTNSPLTNLYKTSPCDAAHSPGHPLGSPPTAQVYQSPAHRLSPVSSLSSAYDSAWGLSPAHSSTMSSGYVGDIAGSSPRSVFSPGQPESLCSQDPNSPSYLSSPQNSPTDSGLSFTCPWSPYSRHTSNSSPVSPKESELSVSSSLSAVSLPQGSVFPPSVQVSQGSVFPPSIQVSQGSVFPTSVRVSQGSVFPPSVQVSQGSYPPTTECTRKDQVSHPGEFSKNQAGPGSSGTVLTTSMTPPAPSDKSGNLLFEYSNEDGDSILHMLVLIFENLQSCGQNKSAASFLQDISRHFLRHPLMKTKLNKQNNMLQTPLYLAVQRNLLPMVNLLVKSGADVNIQGRCEKLPEKVPRMEGALHMAVKLGDAGLNLVQTLLTSYSSNINTQNTEGETPLYVALKEHGSIYVGINGQYQVKDCKQLVQMLLDHGADMDVKEYRSGKTPLMVAIETKDVALVRMVLETCNPRDLHDLLNDSSRDLNTCMHVAFGLSNIAERKHTELVRMLMMKGGEAESENNTNLKAKDMAPNIFKNAVKIFR